MGKSLAEGFYENMIDGETDGLTNRPMDRRMDRWTDGLPDKWTDGWMLSVSEMHECNEKDGRQLPQWSCQCQGRDISPMSQFVSKGISVLSQIVSNRLTLSQIISKDISVTTHFIGKRRKRIIQTIFPCEFLTLRVPL